ncbi:MAG: MerR family transcriptional regulator [Actinobacteria bacterium]|nr:MerR family transcriptional regulator [Actinomycetota bacterium]
MVLLTKKYLTIGEVVTHLRSEFNDLSISKIRYLEDEGLIKPYRTSSGYRKFNREDIERLRLILRLQREKYLPLSIIRKNLENPEASRVFFETDEANLLESQPEEKPEFVQTESASQITGVPQSMIKELENFGIIHAHNSKDGRVYDQTDIELMQLAQEFCRMGIEPRHLKIYQHFAEREASMFEQILISSLKQKKPEIKKQATQKLKDLVENSRQLRYLMLKNVLYDYLNEE